MPQKRYRPEEIIAKLRKADVLRGLTPNRCALRVVLPRRAGESRMATASGDSGAPRCLVYFQPQLVGRIGVVLRAKAMAKLVLVSGRRKYAQCTPSPPAADGMPTGHLRIPPRHRCRE